MRSICAASRGGAASMKAVGVCTAWAALIAILIAIGAHEALFEYLLFPSIPFSQAVPPLKPDYTLASNWATSPLHEETDRAWWVPVDSGEVNNQHQAQFDAFWIHPTTHFFGDWNAPASGHRLTDYVTRLVPMREHAAIFNGECRVFAPHYRQASQGVQDRYSIEEHQPAMDVAFSDVWEAFQFFLAKTKGRPFFVGSHSQGTLHGMRLMQRWMESDAPAEEKSRLVAWYAIGNTVPEAEMAAALPVCQGPSETRCFVSFNTAVEGDVEGAMHWRKKGRPTCVNPLSWRQDERLVGPEHHLGAVSMLSSGGRSRPEKGEWNEFWRPIVYALTGVYADEPPDKELISAQCKDGVLFVSEPSANTSAAGYKYKFNPGGALHAYDINLFYINLRVNIRERARAFLQSFR